MDAWTMRRFTDADAVVRFAAEWVVAELQRCVTRHGQATLALAGGSTPKKLYEALAGRGGEWSRELPGRVAWDRCHIFFGDERTVPHEHAESNFRMAREALLAHVPVPSTHVHPIPYIPDDAGRAAREYDRTLRQICGTRVPGWPVLDVVLLGMGPDGHTASLFPGTTALRDADRCVAAVWVDKLQTSRVTLTVPVIRHARSVRFLITGAEKAPAVQAVLQGPLAPDRWPTQLFREGCQNIEFWLDAAAAGGGAE